MTHLGHTEGATSETGHPVGPAEPFKEVILDSLAEGMEVEEIIEHYLSVSREAVQPTLLYPAELANP